MATALETLTATQVNRLLQACKDGSIVAVENVLGEGVTQEERTALANWKYKKTGFTPLHIVCLYGYHQCIPVLLKHNADPLIWDQCGFAAIHYAARGNNIQCVKLLLQSGKCNINEPTEFGETPFMIACLNGSTDVASYIYLDCECGLTPIDSSCNTVLHYASASDSADLLLKLLSFSEIKTLMDEHNKEGLTALYYACYHGCINSLAALLRHDVNVSSITPSFQPSTLSHSQVALKLGNTRCYGIIENSATPPTLPDLPTSFSFNRQGSQVSENLKQSHSVLPLRSNSSGGSRGSLHSITSTHLQRRSSLVGTDRPVNLTIRRSSSLRKGSRESLMKGSGEEEKRSYLTSRQSANRLSHSMSRQSSRSLDQLLYDSTAYEPPPDILFILPVEKERLTVDARKVFSLKHNIKLRVSREYWSGDNRLLGLNVCLCAAMHYSQTFPEGYTVVSPICFLSCRSKGSCQVHLTLPHAVDISQERSASRIVILSTATAKIDANTQSPFFSPSERVLAPLKNVELELKMESVKFETDLHHPSLFAVAVYDGVGSIPLPLKCCMYVLYPLIDQTVSMVTGFDIEAYIGMNVATVATAVTTWAEKNNLKWERNTFIMSGEQVTMTASLTPVQQNDWSIECRGDGKFHYTQVSLTQHTDHDTYSHQLVYPQRQRFFIEPKNAQSAVKCIMSVSNTIRELCRLMVIPYSPRKATPEVQPLSDHRHSVPSSSPPSHHLPTSFFHDHRYSLPLSTSSTNTSPLHVVSPFPLSTADNTPHNSQSMTHSTILSTSSSTAGNVIPQYSPPPSSTVTNVPTRRSPLLLPMINGHHSESQV